MKKLYFLAIPLIFLFSCTLDGVSDNDAISQKKSVINPPLEGDFQNDTSFYFNPNVENYFETPNGSSIMIPANCIVDADGNLVKDGVDLSFIQYHSTADILASGIPMEYDTLGQKYTFESAGMFSIDAKSNDKPVFIKEGEKITVNLASDTDKDFNYYSLNEQTGDWTFEQNPVKPTRNPKYDPNIVPQEPQKTSDNAFVIDINYEKSDFNELAAFSSVIWEYSGEHDSLDPRKVLTKNNQFTNIDLVPTHQKPYEYFLTFSNRSKKFTTMVKATLNGDEFEKAFTEFKDKKLEMAEKGDVLQKEYIRSVEIEGFGTYNYDFIHSMTEPQRIMAEFDFGDENKYAENALVFVVYKNINAVINYPPEMWNQFAIDKDKKEDISVLAILPGNKILRYNNNISACYGKDKFTFKMDKENVDLSNKKSFNRFIANL